MQVGDRVIFKSNRRYSNNIPSWNYEGKKIIGTVVFINNTLDIIRVFWDYVTYGDAPRYTLSQSTNIIVKLTPLMVSIGTKVYLKDYSDFSSENKNKLATVMLRSTRLGVKVAIGREKKYTSINNIVIQYLFNGKEYCAGCHSPITGEKVLVKGQVFHPRCHKKCFCCEVSTSAPTTFLDIGKLSLCPQCTKHYLIKCSGCKKETLSFYCRKINEKYYCSSCVKDIVYCERCGAYEFRKEALLVGKSYICTKCKKYVKKCRICGKLHWNFVYYTGADYCVCCADKLLSFCSRCHSRMLKTELYDYVYRGSLIREICQRCIDLYEEEKYIHKWNYKPSKFYYSKMKYEKSPLYLGQELEVELPRITSTQGAKATLDYIEKQGISKYYYLKNDGSLARGHSFELVGQPATLAFIRNNYKLYNLLKFFRESGYDCTSSGRCGLHVHISNKNLKFKDIAKIKMFLWKHKKIFELFGNKDKRTQQRYASFEEYEFKDFKRKKMITYEDTKYVACNLTRYTLEFRFWRGTLDHLRYISILTFSEAIAYYIKDASLAKIRYGSFAEFVIWLQKAGYHHLVKYFNLLKLN